MFGNTVYNYDYYLRKSLNITWTKLFFHRRLQRFGIIFFHSRKSHRKKKNFDFSLKMWLKYLQVCSYCLCFGSHALNFFALKKCICGFVDGLLFDCNFFFFFKYFHYEYTLFYEGASFRTFFNMSHFLICTIG